MKSIKALFPLAATLLLMACHNYDSPLEGKKIGDMTFGPEQSYQQIPLANDDVSNISITSSESWCAPSIREATLYVAVTDNTTYEERIAQVDIKDSEDGNHLSFKVTQQPNKAIQIDTKTIEVPQEGGIISIDFKSNLQWEVQPLVDWIKPTTRGTRGLEDYSTQVIVAPNDSGDPREGTVKIKDTASDWYNEVTFVQDFSYSLRISPDAIRMNEQGGEVEVTVQANTSFVVEFTKQTPENWLEEGTQTKTGDNTYKQSIRIAPLSADENYRFGEVFFAHYRDGRPIVYRAMTVEQERDE